MPPRAQHPLLAAAAAGAQVDGVWRVTAASLAAATAAQPLLGQRRCNVSDYDAEHKRVTVFWASQAALAAWETEHLGEMSEKLSKVARSNSALASIFGAAAQAARRGDTFVHHVATGAGSALQRIRFTPLDLEEDEAELAPAAAEGSATQNKSAAAVSCAPARRRVRRCVLDELLPADEPSPQHEQLLLRARASPPLCARERALTAPRHVGPTVRRVRGPLQLLAADRPVAHHPRGAVPEPGVAHPARLPAAQRGGGALVDHRRALGRRRGGADSRVGRRVGQTHRAVACARRGAPSSSGHKGATDV